MKQARVNLTGAQLDRLTRGGELTIRLRDTELILSASSQTTNFMDDFLKLIKEMKK
jgi:hypothetical protein